MAADRNPLFYTDTRRTIRVQRATCVCPADLIAEFEQIYSRWHWTYDLFKSQKGARVIRGRQPLMLGKIANRMILVKRLFHGGLLASLTRDRFLSPACVTAHIHVVDRLRDLGIPTPGIVFSTWRRETGFIRAEIGTEYIGQGQDASELFFHKPGKMPIGWEQSARNIGRLVHRLHAASFLHADLNLMNFYQETSGSVHILDLLKSDLPSESIGTSARKRNLARLIRSVRKQGQRFDPAYVEGVCRSIQEGYHSTDDPH